MKGLAWHLRQKLTPMRFGALGTLAVCLGVYWLGCQLAPGETGGTRASEFWSLPLNSMGDVLAGLAASLAFLWLIVTAFIQRNELKEQRAALEAQRDELELAREVQGKQLKAMEKQAEVFLDEQRARREQRAREVYENLLRILAARLGDMMHYQNVASAPSSLGDDFGFNRLSLNLEEASYTRSLPICDVEDRIARFTSSLSYCKFVVGTWEDLSKVTSKIEDSSAHQEIQTLLDQIVSTEPSLSSGDKIRFRELKINEASQAWGYLRSIPEIWEEPSF